MACHLSPSDRDLLVRLYRADVYRRAGFTEFPHQAAWRLASEGLQLTNQVVDTPLLDPLPFDPAKVTRNDYTLQPTPVPLLIACQERDAGAFKVGETDNWVKKVWQLAIPRPEGIAHRLTDLAAFKAGKSKGDGMWVAGFACLPGATIEMVGMEYKTSEHEFSYLVEALLSGPNAPVKKYKHLYNDVKAGRMYLELTNKCSFEVRSYERKDALRGGQITVYLFNEAYQLPGLEVYTGNAQNLRAERGFALFSSTPDRPWVQVLHRMGHGKNPDWFCVCGSNGFVNPLTFNLTAFMESAPDWETIAEHAPDLLQLCYESGMEPGRLMSKEKFLIAWLGMMGEFVGRVYQFQEGKLLVDPGTHPMLWKPAVVANWVHLQAELLQLRGHAQAQ